MNLIFEWILKFKRISKCELIPTYKWISKIEKKSKFE
jgi:hypothetical protein